MPFNLPKANLGTAPGQDIEVGLAVVRFDGLSQRTVEAFITEHDNYGHADDGVRVDFEFTLMELDEDSELAVIYEDGDPITLRQAKSCKPGSTGKKSNFREYLEAILTTAEFAAWEADEPFDTDKMDGRVFNAKIGRSKSGWLNVETIIGPVKVRKGAK